MILDGALGVSETDLADLGGEYLDWYDPNIDFADFLNPKTNDKTAQYSTSGLSSLVGYSIPFIDQSVQIQQAFYSLNPSIPTMPTYNPRSLIQRPKPRTGAQRIADLILHTLKSYPLMMTHHNTLPPFIHPRLKSSGVEDNHMEPLRNCINLMHMISSEAQGSRKLFWRNVRLECERFCQEVRRVYDGSRRKLVQR